MWIIPKQLMSAYVADTEELISDSEEFSQICEQSLMWRSKHSLAPTWLKRWNRVPWMQRLSGRTLKPSMQNLFSTRWISSLGDSPASHLAMPGKGRVRTILDTCSHLSKELSLTVNPTSSSSKMSKGLFPLSTEEKKEPVFSNMSWEDWKRWVTEQRREYSVRKKLPPHTDEKGYSSPELENFPTMTVSDSFGSRRATAKKDNWKSHDGTTLTDKVQANWPTPDATNAGDGVPWEKSKKAMEERRAKVKQAVKDGKVKQGSGRSPNLAMSVQKWATPNTMDNLPPKSQEALDHESEDVRPGRKQPNNLRDQIAVKEGMRTWPTPTASTGGGSKDKDNPRGNQSGNALKTTVENWATPQARDHKDTPGVSLERKNPQGKERGTNGTLPLEVYSQADQANPNNSGKHQEQSVTKKLSPLWVAQLMGLPTALWCIPVEWMHLDSSETE